MRCGCSWLARWPSTASSGFADKQLSWFVTPSAALWFHTTGKCGRGRVAAAGGRVRELPGLAADRDAGGLHGGVLARCAGPGHGGDLRGAGTVRAGRRQPARRRWRHMAGAAAALALAAGPSRPGPGAAVAVFHPRRRGCCRFAGVRAGPGLGGGVAGQGRGRPTGLAGLGRLVAARGLHRCGGARRAAAGTAALPGSRGPASPGRLERDLRQAATPSGRAGSHRSRTRP